MKSDVITLLIVAIVVVCGVTILTGCSPSAEKHEVVSSHNTSQTPNSERDNQPRHRAPLQQATRAALASPPDSKHHPGERPPALADDLETRFLHALEASRHELNHIKTEMIAGLNGGDTATVQWLHRALGSSDPKLQRHLIQVLGGTASSEALEVLLQFAQAADPSKGEPKRSALRAIAKVEHLRKAPEHSRAAASAILEHYLDTASDDTDILFAVAKGLSTLGQPAGIAKLLEALDTKPEAAGLIVEALGEAPPATATSLLEERLQQDPDLSHPVTHRIGAALGAIGTPQAVQALLTFAANAQDEDAQQTILSWLSRIHDESAVQLLISAQEAYQFADPELGLRLQELGTQMDHLAVASVPLIPEVPGLPARSDIAMAPPERIPKPPELPALLGIIAERREAATDTADAAESVTGSDQAGPPAASGEDLL
jgi:HEAT repeat protein